MIIATSIEDIDRILDYFIADGFISCTRNYKPDLNEWREYIKTEYFSQKGMLIFVPNCNYDVDENKIVKTLNWFVPDTLDEFINE